MPAPTKLKKTIEQGANQVSSADSITRLYTEADFLQAGMEETNKKINAIKAKALIEEKKQMEELVLLMRKKSPLFLYIINQIGNEQGKEENKLDRHIVDELSFIGLAKRQEVTGPGDHEVDMVYLTGEGLNIYTALLRLQETERLERKTGNSNVLPPLDG
jgi:hypothetical protein